MTKDIIRVNNVTKKFGKVIAAENVKLAIREGEFFALLGPSGCGKTTLLRMIAGFEVPDSGQILLDNEDLTNVKAWKRPVNMMFQSYALFPHMTVYDNVAYGLKQEKVSKEEIKNRVEDVLEMVGLTTYINRKPSILSGGQRQRVALARAIVKQPRVLLLDEPLAALDRKLRVEMRLELKRLQNEVGIAFVFVTHDQEEALTMADRAAIMNKGQVLQIGTPEELYISPNTLFVADFIGESNVFHGVLTRNNGEIMLKSASVQSWRLSKKAFERTGLSIGDEAAIIVRPEHVLIQNLELEPFAPQEFDVGRGKIVEIAYLGSSRNYMVEIEDGKRIMVQSQITKKSEKFEVGQEVVIGWDIRQAVLVPA